MSSASRACRACGRPTDRYSELCVHCQRGRSFASTQTTAEWQWTMNAAAVVMDSDEVSVEDRDLRYAVVAD